MQAKKIVSYSYWHIIIMVILGYVFFTAGKRLLLLDLINKNLLVAAGIFIVVAAVAAAFMAYWILKPNIDKSYFF